MTRVRVTSARGVGFDHTVELTDGSNGLDLLRSLGLSPDHWIISRSNKVVPDDEPLLEDDLLLLIGVVSGG